ncbi:MAG: family transcriptional regulator, cyclic receptor protein [Solirubrobacteraceae bacterium]|jgi:CRP-like cAMP-binding protein|nr:family transcriptional regulator, cyclic receptor protein [Solirubrobacteraceae bacterium]
MAIVASSQPSFLQSLRAGDRDDLLALGRAGRWERGEFLVRAGDPADSAIVLQSGLVKIHKASGEGEEVVLGISGPGDLMGEVVAVRDAARSASATALESVQGAQIPVAALRSFLAAHGEASLALLDLTLSRLYVSDQRRLEFATSGALARVASRLVELTERFGAPRGDGAVVEVGLPINQEELASWSASSRESTARALRTLRELGLIQTSRLRLVVLDLPRLRDHAPRL